MKKTLKAESRLEKRSRAIPGMSSPAVESVRPTIPTCGSGTRRLMRFRPRPMGWASSTCGRPAGAVAERVRGASDRIDPTRVPRPCTRRERGRVTPHSDLARGVLPLHADPSVARQRRALPPLLCPCPCRSALPRVMTAPGRPSRLSQRPRTQENRALHDRGRIRFSVGTATR
jgi:hypothetical protein